METRRTASLALALVALVGCSSTQTIGSPAASTTISENTVTTVPGSTTASTVTATSEASTSSTTSTLPPLPTLQVGSSGPAVQQLQEALAARGFEIDTDGIFGPATRAVVATYQGSIGLTDDGIAGPTTLAALGMGQHRSGDYPSLDALIDEVVLYLNSNDAGGLPADIVSSLAWFVYTTEGITPFTILSSEPGSSGSVQVSLGGADLQGTGPYVILQLCFDNAQPFTWCGLWGAYADDGGDF